MRKQNNRQAPEYMKYHHRSLHQNYQAVKAGMLDQTRRRLRRHGRRPFRGLRGYFLLGLSKEPFVLELPELLKSCPTSTQSYLPRNQRPPRGGYPPFPLSECKHITTCVGDTKALRKKLSASSAVAAAKTMANMPMSPHHAHLGNACSYAGLQPSGTRIQVSNRL